MTEERMARPVSGEIMSATGASSPAAEARRASDVVDAEFVTVADSPARRTEATRAQAEAPDSHRPDSRGPDSRGMTILSADAAARSRRAGPAFWLFGIVLVAGAFWVSGGHALVSRPDPSAAAPAAEDIQGGLRIVELTSRVEKTGNGRSYVLVDGQVVNTGRDAVLLPALDIRVTDAAGRNTLYVLGTGERRLAPSARFPFSSRLEAPADGVGTVTVDFSSEVK